MSENMMMVRLIIIFMFLFNLSIHACGDGEGDNCVTETPGTEIPGLEIDSSVSMPTSDLENIRELSESSSRDCTRLSTLEACQASVASSVPSIYPIGLVYTSSIGNFIKHATVSNISKLPYASGQKDGEEDCKKCLGNNVGNVEALAESEHKKIANGLSDKIFEMMENSILERAEVLLEDNYLLNATGDDCDISKWIHDDFEGMGDKSHSVLPSHKIDRLLSSTEKPQNIVVHTCDSGEKITLEKYKSMASLNDPTHKQTAGSLVMALSYISQKEINALKDLRGSPFRNDVNQLHQDATAMDFLMLVSNKGNYEKIVNFLDSNNPDLGDDERENIKSFLSHFAKDSKRLKETVVKGLEEEPAIRYVLSQRLDKFQNKFRSKAWISFAGSKARERSLNRMREKLAKNPYNYFHRFNPGSISDKEKLADFANDGKDVYCEDLENDFDRLKSFKQVFSAQKEKMISYDSEKSRFKVNRAMIRALKRRNKEMKKVASFLESMLAASLDQFTIENKINESNQQKTYHSLALSKCKLNTDYNKLLPSSFPVSTDSDLTVNKPVSLVSDKNKNRYTHWGEQYCSDPEKARRTARNYNNHRQEWVSLHCGLRSCNLEPDALRDEKISALRSHRETSQKSTGQFWVGERNSYHVSNRQREFGLSSPLKKKLSKESFLSTASSTFSTKGKNQNLVSSSRNINNDNKLKSLKNEIERLKNDKRRFFNTDKSSDKNKSISSQKNSFFENRLKNAQGFFGNRRVAALKDSSSSYLNQSDLTLKKLSENKIRNANLTDSQTDELVTRVGGNLDALSRGQVQLTVASDINQFLSVEELFEKISDMDKAKIKELLKAGLPVEIIDRSGHLWKAQKGERRYEELALTINRNLVDEIRIEQSIALNKQRLKYLELIQGSDEVLNLK